MIQERLKELDIILPPAPAPLAAYIPAKKAGGLIFVSGQLPLKDRALMLTGPMKTEEDSEKAAAALRQCFINALAAASGVCSPDEIKSVVKLNIYVASTPEFIWQHKAGNGASELARSIFGDSGVHARAAIGVPSLPLNASVELEVIFSLG